MQLHPTGFPGFSIQPKTPSHASLPQATADSFVRFSATIPPSEPKTAQEALAQTLVKSIEPLKASHQEAFIKVQELLDTWIQGSKCENPAGTEKDAWRDEAELVRIEENYSKELADELRAQFPNGLYHLKPGGVDTSTRWLAETLQNLARNEQIPAEMFDTLLANGLQDHLDASLQRRLPDILNYRYNLDREDFALIYNFQDRDVKPEEVLKYGSPSIMPALIPFIGGEDAYRAENAMTVVYQTPTGPKALPAMATLKANAETVTAHLLREAEGNIWNAVNLFRLAHLGVGPQVLPTLLKAFQSLEDPQVADRYRFIGGTMTSDNPQLRYIYHSESYANNLDECVNLLTRRNTPGLKDLLHAIQPAMARHLDRVAQRNSTDKTFMKDPAVQKKFQALLEIDQAKYLGSTLPTCLTSYEQFRSEYQDSSLGKMDYIHKFLALRQEVCRFQAARGIPDAKSRLETGQAEIDTYITDTLNALLKGDKDLTNRLHQIKNYFVPFALENGSKALLPQLEANLAAAWPPDLLPEPNRFYTSGSTGFSKKNFLPEINSEADLRTLLQFMQESLKGEQAGTLPPFVNRRF